jgi:hypothetical protein
MSTTESDRILAPGVPITLADGREVHLRYGMRALKALEDEFGGLGAVEDVLDTDGRGKMIGPIMSMLAAGLGHESLTADDLLDLTVPSALVVYGEAVAEAFSQAFPSSTQGKAPSEETVDSPGETSTSSPPSGTAAATPPSGA